MSSFTNLIIDFDSTFTQVEALDELAKIVLKNNINYKEIAQQIETITNQAMNGELSFDKALEQRLALLSINKKSLNELIILLKEKVSNSVKNNKIFLQENANRIYIISGGFIDFIAPVVIEYGINIENIFANEFIFDTKNNVIGFDKKIPLCKPKGKVEVIKNLQLPYSSIVIGDGYTDYEIKEAGLVKSFYLYTENITRQNLVNKADKIISTFDEIVKEKYDDN